MNESVFPVRVSRFSFTFTRLSMERLFVCLYSLKLQLAYFYFCLWGRGGKIKVSWVPVNIVMKLDFNREEVNIYLTSFDRIVP